MESYRPANLNDQWVQEIRKLEQQLHAETNEEIVVIAYKKSDESVRIED